ncbi:hypothetical protein [Paraconexibacter sp.]|uniref:hypothetical protein n=1 Tax=Paraconexibacter sp. TaxID=2949640 RepID=UPI003565167B
MRRVVTTVLATAVAVPVALAAPGPADARVRMATFDVQVEGRQTTTWQKHHVADGPCDVDMHGSGSETFRFRSKTLRVTAFWTGKRVELVGPHGAAELVLRGTARRSGQIHTGEGEPCGSGDGDIAIPSPPPDCGTKTASSTVELAYFYGARERIVLSGGDGYDPFNNCPGGAPQAPYLLTHDGKGTRIGQRLPHRDLFRYGKSIVVARGKRLQRLPDTTTNTDIRWTVSFKRVEKRKASR